MIVFLKYLRGYLRIRVWGFSPERFMNLCSNKGILLWNITRQGDAYEMCIDIKGFRQLRPIVRKTGTRAVHRHYRRKGGGQVLGVGINLLVQKLHILFQHGIIGIILLGKA